MVAQHFWDEVLAFAEATTKTVGQKLLEDFGQVRADLKADGSLVTRCDRWADDTLRAAIHQTFPDHGVLSEEVEHIFPDTDWCWIIDPIDGTTNFTRGIPVWGISLGLLYRGTPVFGYVAMPPLDQSFYGYWPGQSGLAMPSGAFCNGHPIHSSDAEPDKTQFFSLCARSTSVLEKPFPCKIRMLGSAAYNLLLVGAGWAVGAVEATPKIWDIAAVWAITQAAGATWVLLDDVAPFPLEVGKDYSTRPYPTLATAQDSWVEFFRPLVQQVANP
ncbi:inositol monophosphatase family protein [Leptolyngbya sp. CCNP1308]|uniref:inositol monophosphatase family protein n=1 Tax=Leptolyngbya sp. CCNP1308 TaxID=3110255 RepID=UPI002B21B7A6|nr:inositol monophosphatase family protein [Leptolyngbya sp. CCNP1308]MEA5451397.1 inositol monophosphatase family protein [Leptolyngbya sp. CCNP1308]